MREVEKKDGGMFLYIVVSAWVFVITLTVLNITGYVPYYMDGTPSREVAEAAADREAERLRQEQEDRDRPVAAEPQAVRQVLPTRLEIPVLGKDLPISNPNTTNIDELDNELLTAVVRYPGSGTLGADGNMLIFGHSSGLRTVNNKMFKAFNGLKTLEEGNVIKLVSGGIEYIYTVSSLQHEEASNVTINFGTAPGVKQLTLTTCDSFGSKSDRWIITADFIGSYKAEG